MAQVYSPTVAMLHPGVESQVISVDSPEAGGTSRDIILQSDTVLITLWVQSLTGNLSIDVFGLGSDDHAAPLFSFPVISSPTPQLLLRRAQICPARVRISTTYTGPANFEVRARAIYSGLSDARVLGSTSFFVSQVDVPTTPVLLIPASLLDRSGLVVKNWDPTTPIYLAESALKADPSIGYPLSGRDALALDVAAGVEVWAVADSGVVDTRLAEAGG